MTAKNLAYVAILKTDDEGKTWAAVPPEEVPEELKTDECMSVFRKGRYCGLGGVWYMGVRVDSISG